jgi:hypothetical protein
MSFFADPTTGAYLGQFLGAAPPAGAVATPTAPARGDQIWTGEAWSDPADPPEHATLSREQWFWALRRYGLRGPIEALAAAVEADDPDAAADIDARAFGGDVFTRQRVDALLSRHAAALLAAAPDVDLSPAAVDAMWASAAARRF